MADGPYVYRSTATPQTPPFSDRSPLINGSTNQPVSYVREVIFLYTDSQPTFIRRLLRCIAFVISIFLLFFVVLILLRLILLGFVGQYFLLTFRWPTTACDNSTECSADWSSHQKWIIHGLWPENTDNTWNQFCKKEPFNMTTIETLKPRLMTDWPNLLKGRTYDSLWQHEWEKHGTCSRMNEFDYFNKTLKLYDSIPLDKWLAQENIVPTMSRKYSVQEFRTAIESHIDSMYATFNCVKHHGNYFISEVMFCYDFFDAQTNVVCTVKSNCDEPFYYYVK